MSYQGHRSWNSWNVSLWIHNDEGLYLLAKMCIAEAKRIHATKHTAAQLMFDDLTESNITETPQGAPYTVTSIREAMRGM